MIYKRSPKSTASVFFRFLVLFNITKMTVLTKDKNRMKENFNMYYVDPYFFNHFS